MHIFISYAKADTRDLALQLSEALNTLPDVTAWMDTSLYSGEDWALQIQDEIDRADLVVVLLSRDVNRPANHPNGRSFVLKEIHYAQQVKKTIIPVMAQKAKMPVQLAGIQYIDLTSNQAHGFQQLTNDILRFPTSTQSKVKSIAANDGIVEDQKRRFMDLPARPPRSWYIYTFVLAALAISALVFSNLNNQNSLALSLIKTPTLSSFSTSIPLGFPGNPVTKNTDWSPQYQTFGGYEMALVPVGCFMMGSNDGEEDEKPVNQQCFDQPYWIDHYEVTNKQYASEGYFKGDNRPRDSVTWFDAHDFCEKRGARLPTEREGEYATRGPDNLIYPWGMIS